MRKSSQSLGNHGVYQPNSQFEYQMAAQSLVDEQYLRSNSQNNAILQSNAHLFSQQQQLNQISQANSRLFAPPQYQMSPPNSRLFSTQQPPTYSDSRSAKRGESKRGESANIPKFTEDYSLQQQPPAPLQQKTQTSLQQQLLQLQQQRSVLQLSSRSNVTNTPSAVAIPKQIPTTDQQMNINTHTTFALYKFNPNSITNIYFKDETGRMLYLSCNSNNTEVGFSEEDDGHGRQKWIIELDEDDDTVVYIKTAFYHPLNNVQYLGSPNASGLVYLYTSKTKYTKWTLSTEDNLTYTIAYAGEQFDKTKINIVVARYNEDIAWTKAYNDIVTIYDKGLDTHPALNDTIKLENVGRGGHTYLYHIIENYDNLAEQTIFTQCDPFVHNPTILCGIDNHYLLDDVQALGLYYFKKTGLPPIQYTEERKVITDFGLEYLRVQANGDLICPEFVDQGMIELRKNADNDYKGIRFKSKPITEGFLNRAIFPISKPLNKVTFTFGGMFSVKRDRILNYPKIVYQGLIEELTSKNPQGGVNGYILEKLWLYIFED